MNREGSIKYAKEIKAYQEGKIIEVFLGNIWRVAETPTFDAGYMFRIKPELTKRLPTIKEVEQWFLDNKVFRFKDTGTLERILTFQKTSEEPICDSERDWHSIQSFLNLYSDLDGSELYITEN